MSKVVSLAAVRNEHADAIERAWDRFVAAKIKSEQTLKLADGVAAGKAYREFCDLFARRQ
jgi:hypothetical protein